jgi:hypothetical protein
MHPYELGINPKVNVVLHKTYALTDVKKPTKKQYADYIKLANDYKHNILHENVKYELNKDGMYYALYIQRTDEVEGIYFTVRKKY